MNLKQALKKASMVDGFPIIRQCCGKECGIMLDDVSQIIFNARPHVEYIISHGYCEECVEKTRVEIDELLGL